MKIISNQAKKAELERKMREIIGGGKKVKGFVLDFGGDEFLFDGGFTEFGTFLESSGFKKLKRIRSTDTAWHSWEDDYKRLDEKFSDGLKYMEDVEGIEEQCDIAIKEVEHYTVEQAKEMERLQNEYKGLLIDKKGKSKKK